MEIVISKFDFSPSIIRKSIAIIYYCCSLFLISIACKTVKHQFEFQPATGDFDVSPNLQTNQNTVHCCIVAVLAKSTSCKTI